MKKQLKKPARSAVSAAILGLLTGSSVYAGGFSLYTEASPAAIGNYAAGAAAEAVDASTGWYNPAGLSLLHKPQVVFGGIGVFPSSKLTGTSTYQTVVSPLLPPINYVQSFSGMDGASNAFVPSVHAALPVSDKVTFGLSLVSPFGLATEWGVDSPVRYSATFTELITMNISPELGVRVSDFMAVGGGLDVQYARVKFNRMLGAPALLQSLGASPYQLDSMSYNKGKSYGFGFHAGVMFLVNEDHTRFGINYQSEVNHQFFGYSQLSGPLAADGINLLNPFNRAAAVAADPAFRTYDLYSNNVGLPQILTLSAYHDVNDKIALLASAVFSGWHSFKTIELNNVAAVAPVPGVVNGLPAIINHRALVQSISPEYYKDAWRFALGANYKVNDQMLVRVGGGYDQTPTRDGFRDIRLPDTNRWALSVGGHYQMYPSLGFDLGYTHLFSTGHSSINDVDPLGSSNYFINAEVNAHADLVGLQAVWTMDAPTPAPYK